MDNLIHNIKQALKYLDVLEHYGLKVYINTLKHTLI